MAMYRPGAVTAFIQGSVVGDAGSGFDMLARSVVLSATTEQKDVTADGDVITVHANNGLVGGRMRIDGWADGGSEIKIQNLAAESTLTNITITIMPTGVTTEEIAVLCSVESVRVAYEKTSVGVAVSLVCKVADVNHTA